MSGCEDVKERLCEFLDGELAQADRAVVESHLQSCTVCREELSALREASSAVSTLERRPAPASILAGVRSGLKQQPQAPKAPSEIIRPEPSFWWRRALSVAAVLIVAVLIYVAYIPQHREERAMATPEAKSAAKPSMARESESPKTDAPATPAPVETTSQPLAAADDFAPGRDAKSQSFAKAKATDLRLEKARKVAEEPSVLAESNQKADESKRRVAPLDLETAEAKPSVVVPNAPAPVAQGTPRNVAEGAGRPLSKEAVVQQLKDGLSDLTRARDTKLDSGISQKPKQEEKDHGEIAQTERPNEKSPPVTPALPASKPAATTTPEEPRAQIAQVGEERNVQDAGQKVVEVAQGQQRESELPRSRKKGESIAAAKSPALAGGKGNESRDLAESQSRGMKLSANEENAQRAEETKTASVLPARQVLIVPLKDLAVVVEDLRRLAASSGGELAWQPSQGRRAQKKEEQQQAQPTKELLGVEQAVMRVPPVRMAELLRATEQYRAQLRLSMEAARNDKQSFDARAASTLSKTATQADEDGVEYIQIVLDIQPQTVAAAADATHSERGRAEESEKAKE